MERSNIYVQFGLYLVVGGSSTVVDLGGFAFLQWLGVSVVLASPTSFVAGTVFNYFASYIVAFQRGRFSRSGEVARLFAVALVALLLNSLCVWLFLRFTTLSPQLAKTLAVPCVLLWNFLGRRWLVFHKEMPEATYRASKRLIGDE